MTMTKQQQTEMDNTNETLWCEWLATQLVDGLNQVETIEEVSIEEVE